jgi:hypothetical protein
MTGTGLDDERAYLAECRTALLRMIDGARLNVVIGERVAGDRYSAERLGRHLKSLAKELSEEPDGPPFFGRLDFGSGERRGQRYYIGRRHISGGTGQQPMVPAAGWTLDLATAAHGEALAPDRRRSDGWADGDGLTRGFGRTAGDQAARSREMT